MRLSAPDPVRPSYVPPQPTFRPCPQCGALCGQRPAGALVTPLLGVAHNCLVHRPRAPQGGSDV
jgi:hypothetical protein